MKRKKNTRQRGGTTHGWGSMKKHRGKGNKGGSGNAGTGKRGDAKKPSIWKLKYFGKMGFTSKVKKKVNAINIKEVERNLQKWLDTKKAVKESEGFKIDLSAIGYNKLLGGGTPKNKLFVKVDSAAENAVKKVADRGGKVTK